MEPAEKSAYRPYLEWLETPLGQLVTRLERKALERAVSKVFGHYLVQCGSVFPRDYMAAAYVRRCFVLGEAVAAGLRQPTARCDVASLPLATNSVDALVLPHVIEFSDDPHQILREVDRVLVDDGQVFIVSFNRLGWWGIKQALTGRRRVPWLGDPYRIDRIVDWLGVLGFEVEAVEPMMYWPKGLKRFGLLRRLATRGLPLFSGVCLISGKKRVIPLTPFRPEARAPRKLVAIGFGKPAARTEIEDRQPPR